MTDDNRKIVLGLGNILNKDEGLGVFALKALEVHLGNISPGIEFVDGGVLGLNLLLWVEECSHLLVLDAIDAKKQPGTVVEMDRDEIPMYRGIKMSDHQITFQEVLGLASFRSNLPRNLFLIGAQPDDISIGVGLSSVTSAVIPDIVSRAEVKLVEWGLI